jgi:hypothetical protein
MCISKLTTEDEKLVEVIKQVSHYMSENADCDRQTDRPVNSVHWEQYETHNEFAWQEAGFLNVNSGSYSVPPLGFEQLNTSQSSTVRDYKFSQ